MNYQDLSAFAIDLGNDIVYISDINNYKLYYLNKSGMEALGCADESDWFEKPCYKVLQNLDEPCSFCTNKYLVLDKFYTWEFFNPVSQCHYSIRDKLINLEGNLARLEIALDVTERALVEKKLREKLLEEETLVSCIQTLRESTDVDHAISNLLEIISKYHDADRAYIFEVDYDKEIICNTYEWCAENISAEIDNLKALPMKVASRWFDQFKSHGEIYINSLHETVDNTSPEYVTLSDQGIENIMAAPLYDNGLIVGFLGVDNPKTNTHNMSLIHSLVVFIMDDLNKRAFTEKLTSLSFFDSLTGLKNRNCYMQTLERLADSSLDSFGVVFVDINGLKIANDTFGHQYGDELIAYTAEILKRIFDDNIFRIGGDEFVIICENIDKANFNKLSLYLRDASNNDPKLHISIGTSWRDKNINIIKQIEGTDKMMYLDKQRYYSTVSDTSGGIKSNSSHELLVAIENGSFVIFLQPLVDLTTGKITAVEALTRRIDSHGNYILPIYFISDYERDGIIRHVDFYVLKCVCSILSSWRTTHSIEHIRMSVNFSYITLLENDIAKQIFEVCCSYNINPKNISIEIAESINLIDRDMFSDLLNSLISYGLYISLDGFGSDAFNLSVLSLTGFDEIKLDEVLIKEIATNSRSQIIVARAIELFTSLHFDTFVAKGVETKEQYEILRNFGFSIGQGIFFEKPLPVDEFTQKYIAQL